MENARGDSAYRTPPYWSPENEEGYSFRAWTQDLQMWMLFTDLQPHQQAAALVLRVGGAAREQLRSLTPQELTNGGVMYGQQLEPVTYIVAGLQARFAQLGDEGRLAAMTQLLAFQRLHGESINAVLTRYDTVR